MKEQRKIDLTRKEDLGLAVMNLINLEEHLAFTVMKTKKDIYLDVLEEVREIRINLLKKLVTNTEGEMWCISKHLLATIMRLMESSTKYLKTDIKQAMKMNSQAFDLYTLFWFLQKIGGKHASKKTGKEKNKAKK